MGQRLQADSGNNSEPSVSERLGTGLASQAKVLIVDDEPDIVEEVVEHLEHEGLECISAFDALSAMKLVKADPEIGVVVTDIRMPGMDGLEMANQMKVDMDNGRDLIIIVVTGHAGMKEAIEALKIGAEDFLTKPISPDHLLHSVNRAEEMIQHRRNERNFQSRLEREVEIKTVELSETYQNLETANRIKDQFMSTMGHELRTPLNAINGFADILKNKLKNYNDPAVGEYLDHILNSGTRLGNTIENILEFTATISGNRKAQMESQVLEDMLEHVSSQAREAAEDKSINIEIVDLPDNQLFEADYVMLTKALACLVDNAIKFSSDGSVIILSAERFDDRAVISIKDQGCGMSEDEIALALQPLSQVDSTLSRPTEGSGIGLSLAVLLTEVQGGHVEINSKPDEGTTVRIVMPQPDVTQGKVGE